MWFEANKIAYNNQENHLRAFSGSNIAWVIVPEDNKIFYISNDGNVFNPAIYGNVDAGFGANIVSNTYTNGLGVITFDGPVTRIGRGTFERTSLSTNWVTDVFIPDSVTSINDEAYTEEGFSMTHITKSVNNIRPYGFDLNLDFVSVDPSNSKYSVVNNSIIDTSTGELVVGTNNSYVDSNITSIGEAAFSRRKYLTTISIPNGQTSIGGFTFYSCIRLNNVNIPSTVLTIGRESFVLCTSLSNITIPASVNSIGYYAFSYCTNLVEIVVNATTPPSLASEDPDTGIGVFGIPGEVSGRRIKVPSNLVHTYKTASGWSYYASEIVAQ